MTRSANVGPNREKRSPFLGVYCPTEVGLTMCMKQTVITGSFSSWERHGAKFLVPKARLVVCAADLVALLQDAEKRCQT